MIGHTVKTIFESHNEINLYLKGYLKVVDMGLAKFLKTQDFQNQKHTLQTEPQSSWLQKLMEEKETVLQIYIPLVNLSRYHGQTAGRCLLARVFIWKNLTRERCKVYAIDRSKRLSRLRGKAITHQITG
jgi:hypothetical protein